MSADLHTVGDWQDEVANGNTTLGYAAWLAAKLEAEADDDGPTVREYGVRLWGTFRGVAETEIEATSFDEALKKAAELDHMEFSFKIEDGIEGDETVTVFGPDDEHDDDPWSGDGGEIDKRAAGEPFSWEAVAIVKELAMCNPVWGMTPLDVLADLINRAKRACTKAEGRANG